MFLDYNQRRTTSSPYKSTQELNQPGNKETELLTKTNSNGIQIAFYSPFSYSFRSVALGQFRFSTFKVHGACIFVCFLINFNWHTYSVIHPIVYMSKKCIQMFASIRSLLVWVWIHWTHKFANFKQMFVDAQYNRKDESSGEITHVTHLCLHLG